MNTLCHCAVNSQYIASFQTVWNLLHILEAQETPSEQDQITYVNY